MVDQNVNAPLAKLEPQSEKTLMRLVTFQVAAAIAIGVVIVGSILWIALVDTSLRPEAFETLSTWGGTIIGFFFGSMFSQNAKLIEALRPTRG